MTEVAKADSLKHAEGTEAAKVYLNLRGVECPTNFVKAKMFLSKLPLETCVEIVLDDGEPIDSVPASLTMEGYEIISEEMNPGGETWTVIVKK